MGFLPRHDGELMGALLADAGPGQQGGGAPLVGLFDLAESWAELKHVPPGPAVFAVCERLEARGADLYLTKPGLWAESLTDEYVWEPRQEARAARVAEKVTRSSGWSATDWGQSGGYSLSRKLIPEKVARVGLHGVAGALELVRRVWGGHADSKAAKAAAQRHGEKLQRLAMLVSEARALFPELPGLTDSRLTVAPATASRLVDAAPQVVQPEGGQWPHVEGTPWTEDERIAMFLMRHRDNMTGEKLAGIVGQTRQRIDEVIGPAKPHGGLSKAKGKDGWTPSAELLAACGQALQPLQSVALAMKA